MTVKNIMFSGVMAAILMAGANAHAAVEIASRGYVDTEVAKKADATEFSTLKGVVENADTGLATKASKTELSEGLALKANAADVYTKTEADETFEKLGVAQAYTDQQLQELLKDFGTAGGDGEEATGLQGTVASQGVRITSLEDKVGTTKVADQISNAITALDLANTYGAKSDVTANTNAINAINNAETGLLAQAKADASAKADKALADAKAYTDGKVTDMATNSSVDTKLSEYTKTTALDSTFATDSEVTGVKTELEGKIDAKVATETYNAKVGELEDAIDAKVAQSAYDTKVAELSSAITTEKERAEGVEDGLNTRLTTAEGTISTLSNDLATKITKPAACQTGNCVLAMMNGGNPEWIVLTLPTE